MSDKLAADAVIEKPVETTETLTETKPVETAEKPTQAAVEPKAAETAADTSKGAGEAGKGEETGKEAGSPPDDWRDWLTGGNEEVAKIVARYSSPASFAKKILEQEKVIKSGRQARPMPDASDEKAMAEWRKEQGIPDDPSGYKLPETVMKSLTDEDKPMLASFTEFAHKKGGNQAAVDLATEWYVSTMDQIAEQQAADDKAAHEAAEDALRKDWAHGEYKANTNLAHRFLEAIPGVGTDFAVARLPNGRLLVQDPAFVAWAADMGRNQFGDVTFANGDSERKHTARKQEIEELMRTDINAYREKGWDKEYQQILDKEAKRGAR